MIEAYEKGGLAEHPFAQLQASVIVKENYSQRGLYHESIEHDLSIGS